MTDMLAPWGRRRVAARFAALTMFASTAAHAQTCPDDMVLVRGVHYENVQRWCTRYERSQCWSFFPGLMGREPRFTPVLACIDRYEWPNQKGAMPEVMVRYVEAQKACGGIGKRLCTEIEWELACEGPQTLPWPYGWSVDPNACNNHQPYRTISESRLASSDPTVRERETKRLYQGEASGSREKCVSPFGAYDLVGNIEEWVQTSRPEWPYESSLKGGYWSKPWTGCRGTNDSHGPMFRFYETGFRCCSDPDASGKETVAPTWTAPIVTGPIVTGPIVTGPIVTGPIASQIEVSLGLAPFDTAGMFGQRR